MSLINVNKKKAVREQFRRQCSRRDKYRCAVCHAQGFDHFDTHHITNRKDMPNGGYVKENGITLCPPCHLKAELREPSYEPERLYEIIGSSYEKAVEASAKI